MKTLAGEQNRDTYLVKFEKRKGSHPFRLSNIMTAKYKLTAANIEIIMSK